MTQLTPIQTRSQILAALGNGSSKTAGDLFDVCGRHYPRLYEELRNLLKAKAIVSDWQHIDGMPAIVYRRVQLPQPALFNPFRFPSSA
jgi:hypothetical protein